MKLSEIQKERAELEARQVQLYKRADSENRKFTVDELDEIDSTNNRISELDEKRSEVREQEARTACAEREAEMSERSKPVVEARPVQNVNERMNQYIRGIIEGRDALTTTLGGGLIPTDLAGEVTALADRVSAVRQAAKVVNVARAMNVPRQLAYSDQSEGNESFVKYFSQLIHSIKNDLGKEIRDSDSMEVKELRAIINKLIGTIENEKSFVNFYSSKFQDGSIEEIEDGSLYNTTLYISALDPEIKIEQFLEKFLNAGSPQIEGRYRAILGIVRDPNAGRVIVQSMLDGTIRGADCPYILASMIANKVTGRDSWSEIKDNYSGLLGVMPEWTASRILSGLDGIFDRELGDDIRSFITANPLPSAEKLMAQKLEKLEANMELVKHINSTLDESILEK